MLAHEVTDKHERSVLDFDLTKLVKSDKKRATAAATDAALAAAAVMANATEAAATSAAAAAAVTTGEAIAVSSDAVPKGFLLACKQEEHRKHVLDIETARSRLFHCCLL